VSELEIALKAVELYASQHPRPVHVNRIQAAEMLGISDTTVRKLIRAGTIKVNKLGLIPMSEIDKAIKAA
jgi:excisionase family DNA binding protein